MIQAVLGRQRSALAACYFFYFAVLGLLVPYLGVFLTDLGFDALAIGQLMAILFATRIIAPNLWAYLADRFGHRVRFVQIGALMALLLFAFTLEVTSFEQMALVLFGYTFCWNGILPQLEVVTLRSLGKDSHLYSVLRSFGSLGFIALVLGAGWWFESHGNSALPWFGVSLFALLTFASIWLREPDVDKPLQAPSSDFFRTLTSKPVLLFLLACALIQASHSPYYTFFVLYLRQLGIGESVAGMMISAGVVAEIVVFALMPKLITRFGIAKLMVFTAIITAMRWGLTVLVGANELLQLGVQLLHGISFGLGHGCAIQYVYRQFSPEDQGKAQAFYASIAFGLGGASGAWLAGISWQHSPTFTWWGAAIAASLAALMLAAFSRCRAAS
ncbi:MFS transporter [Ferrimonas senticii]|uniref:MFS transporter n=1 Tax=Ferrimonas senticii TaxID=394566 RepID=UPI0003F5A2EF|nr:MFS transporter [Ferrimonas senticii]